MRTALLVLAGCTALSAQQSTTFRKVFDAISAPAVSEPLPNIGQSAHLIAVAFPSALTDVNSNLQVRIEASYDASIWFPISRDVTTARFNGSQALAIERANAAYPFVRVRALQAPATPAMTVYYTGSQQPVGQVLCDAGGCTATPPQTNEQRATWNLCASAPCATGTSLTVAWIATRTASFTACYIAAETAPVGSPLTVDVNRNGTSIFGASKLQLASGSSYAKLTAFALRTVAEGDLLSIDIDAVGSTTAGQRVNVTCSLQ
jgi:hypothetical protein